MPTKLSNYYFTWKHIDCTGMLDYHWRHFKLREWHPAALVVILKWSIWWQSISFCTTHYIMAACVFVVGKVVFYHGNSNILKLGYWFNYEKQLILHKFKYTNNHLYSMKKCNHVKLRYTDPCNLLTKRALLSQPSILVIAKDSNISHYLNLSMNVFANYYPFHYIIDTQCDCPSQMNSNVMISITKLTCYCSLICCC